MANVAGDAQLFDDSFTVTEYDQSKYDRVARITTVSTDNQTTMKLDVNVELFPVSVGEGLHVVLATSLRLDGARDDDDSGVDKGWKDVRADNDPTLADQFDYVCHGKVYRFEDVEDGQVIRAYISFGGLLMQLEGPYKKLTPLQVQDAYLLIKK